MKLERPSKKHSISSPASEKRTKTQYGVPYENLKANKTQT